MEHRIQWLCWFDRLHGRQKYLNNQLNLIKDAVRESGYAYTLVNNGIYVYAYILKFGRKLKNLDLNLSLFALLKKEIAPV